MAITATKEKLQKRVKELNCLYRVSSTLIEDQGDNKKKFQEISRILKQAWRFPNAAMVEFKLGSYYECTSEIPSETIWQKADIIVFNEKKGFLKVHYSVSDYALKDFLEEEQQLLNKVSYDVGAFYEKQLQKEQEELLKRTAQRNDRLSILGEITAGIAHELNTPLGNILGFAELINNRVKNGQTKQDISKIIKAALISREVVKKLMFFACEMPQKMEVIKVVPLISDALALLGPNFKKAEVDYEFVVEDKEIEAQLDPIQLTQVLFNLLINALFVSPKNTLIQIKVYSEEKDFFIEIADQGPGIEEKDKSKIFEPFFTTKPVGEGSGLGLSVVHGIVRSHKGNITTFKNKPTGAVFRVQLPLKT